MRDDLFIIPSLKSCLRNQLTSMIPFDIKGLRRRGKQYRPPVTGTVLRRPDTDWFLTRSIDLRPPEVDQRLMVGHWEADSVLSGRKGKGALATFVERKTRKYVAYKLRDHTSNSMYLAFKQLMKDFKGAVHSVHAIEVLSLSINNMCQN